MLKRFVLMLGGLFAMAMLVSCGEESIGGGVGEFTTVTVVPGLLFNRVESDIISSNTCSGGQTSSVNTVTDNILFPLTSRTMSEPGLPVAVTRYIIRYTPVGNAPELDDIDRVISPLNLPAGGSINVFIPILPLEYKNLLLTHPTQPFQPCTAGLSFSYNVTITLEVSELGGNGDVEYLSGTVNLVIVDRF